MIAQPGAPTRTTETSWYPSDEIAQRARTRSDNGAKVLDRRYFADDGRLLRLMRTRESDGKVFKDRTYSYDDSTNSSAVPAAWGNGNRSSDEKGTYRFNARGQMIEWVRRDGQRQDYSLDGQGQIKQVSGPGIATTTYSYDGDQLQSTTTAGHATAYSYWELGELRKIDYDAADTRPDESFGYDAYSRLTSLDKGADRHTTYRYDGLDRKEQRTTTAGANTTTRVLSYVGSSEQLASESTTSTGDPDKRRSYDYDSSLERLGQGIQTGTGGSVSYRSYALAANGDVEGLEEADGHVAARYDYDPYGADRAVDETGETPEDAAIRRDVAPQNPFRFQGRYLDDESSAYDMQARDYRPDIARFLSPDRFEAADQDLALQLDPSTNSRYAFLAGDPVDQIDFDGHEPPSSFTDCYEGSIYCSTPRNKKERKRGKQIQKVTQQVIQQTHQKVQTTVRKAKQKVNSGIRRPTRRSRRPSTRTTSWPRTSRA